MKYIFKMAFRNIGRNKRRTMLSAIAISIAVMVVLVMRGYIGGVMDSMFDSLTKIETGHIRIVHREYYEKEDMMPLEYMVDGFGGEGYEQIVSVLKDIKGVNTIAPRIKFGVLLSFRGKNRSALGIGIDPENSIASLDEATEERSSEPPESGRTLMIGQGLASKLGVKLNDKITIMARAEDGSPNGMTFTVTGIFRYGISSIDDKLFYIPIDKAAGLLKMGNGVSELVLMIDKPEDAEKVAAEIDEKLKQHEGAFLEDGETPRYEVVPWQKSKGMLSMLETGNSMYRVIYIGLMILASTVIINTTMMVIYERIREIGTIGALGMTGGQIVLLFVIEAMIISAIGSLIGTIVGGGLDFLLHKVGININALTGGSMDLPATDKIKPRFGLSILVWSFLFGIIVATVVACIPARRAAKIEPVEALRSV